MGLLRMAARTAVVAGTATAVSGRVQRRQAEKYDQQDQQAYDQQQRAAAAARRRRAGGRHDRAAPEPGAAPQAGRAHRRGVRGRQGQDPRDLTDRTPAGRETRRGVLAAGRGLRRDRHRPLPRPLGLVPPRALERRPGGRALGARSVLRHRPPRRRADRAGLPGRRRRRLRGDARPSLASASAPTRR